MTRFRPIENSISVWGYNNSSWSGIGQIQLGLGGEFAHIEATLGAEMGEDSSGSKAKWYLSNTGPTTLYVFNVLLTKMRHDL